MVIPVEVHDNIIPAKADGSKPEKALENYVKVIFKAGEGGTVSGDLVYYVSPEVEVNMTGQAEDVTKTPSVGYTSNGGTWSPEIIAEKITAEKTYEFNFVKSEDIVEKTDDPNQVIPEGYVKVTFKTDGNGKVNGADEKIYYVNPKAGITLKVLGDNETATDKQLAVPTTTANANHVFKEWQEAIDENTAITSERVHVAIFVPVEKKVTLTYNAGEGTGTVPPVVTVDHGTTVALARPEGLSKENATFVGWKIGETTYKPGDQVTLNENTTATAQWEKITTPSTPGDQDNPNKPNPGYPGGPGYPSYPDRPYIPMYPEVRYETIIKEKIVKVPVPVTDGYFKEVRYMQGFNGYFRPNDGLTRAEAAQILANALVEDGYKYNPNFKISYKDVGEAWYTRAVKIVTEAKVFTGYDDGNFKPQAKITRNEWIATLKRFQELGDASGNNMKLRDGHWAKAEIQAAFNEGWLKIYTDGLATYKGDEFIPRQEVAAVSNKAFKRIVDKTYIGKNNLSLVTYKDVNTSMWAYEDILCASNTFLDRKDRYIAHWVKEDKNQFNIDTSDFKIVQKNFQRNPR